MAVSSASATPHRGPASVWTDEHQVFLLLECKKVHALLRSFVDVMEALKVSASLEHSIGYEAKLR
eukprot:1158529-Pelagomonas_calceolata.AAC.2